MRLLELFQNIAPWKWKGETQAEFEAGGNSYHVQFIFLPSGEDGVGFGMINPETGKYEEGNTGTGSGLLVFSTVMDIIKEYVKRENPESLLIPAVVERERLYTRMVTKIAPSLGYELSDRQASQQGAHGKVVFLTITRQDLHPK